MYHVTKSMRIIGTTKNILKIFLSPLMASNAYGTYELTTVVYAHMFEDHP